MARPFRLDRVDAARNFLIESAEHDHVFVFSALAEDSKSAAAQRAAARAEAPSAGETAPVQAALAPGSPAARAQVLPAAMPARPGNRGLLDA